MLEELGGSMIRFLKLVVALVFASSQSYASQGKFEAAVAPLETAKTVGDLKRHCAAMLSLEWAEALLAELDKVPNPKVPSIERTSRNSLVIKMDGIKASFEVISEQKGLFAINGKHLSTLNKTPEKILAEIRNLLAGRQTQFNVFGEQAFAQFNPAALLLVATAIGIVLGTILQVADAVVNGSECQKAEKACERAKKSVMGKIGLSAAETEKLREIVSANQVLFERAIQICTNQAMTTCLNDYKREADRFTRQVSGGKAPPAGGRH